ncbi:hypothetical protein [Clostridium lacusfryxellense]|uniref:hypothetical protein n=1 Tax=Clostridium lacusfryxellense TaxID=205328 RepID=UPI001C0B5A52|nr:hypothetical protein [Clostridium lacusfryxellense]MBU3110347.1 hypothetical protein [Clostridium lacusfryxellense]
MNIVKWFNIHSGFSVLLITLLLAIIIIYYADQTKKQVNYAHKNLDIENTRMRNVALNYIILLNTEIAAHRQIFIIYIYYKFYSNNVPINLDNIFKSLNSKMWDKLFPECAKCLSNKLMEELSGYYYGVDTFKEIELTDVQKDDTVKSQLISMFNCINIAEIEFDEKLRKQDVYLIDGKKVSVDKTNGELIIELV